MSHNETGIVNRLADDREAQPSQTLEEHGKESGRSAVPCCASCPILDREVAPTAWAYEQACAALKKTKDRVSELESELRTRTEQVRLALAVKQAEQEFARHIATWPLR